jgi:hypothetical protein
MVRFGSDYKEVSCADGPRYILKKPEKAFSIAAPNWDIRIKSLLTYYNTLENSLDIGLKKEIKTLISDLTENYAALQAHYQAVYLAYCMNPCSKEAEKSCLDAMSEIREKEYNLRELEIKTELLNKKFSASGSGIAPLKQRKLPEEREKGLKTFLQDRRGEIDFTDAINEIKRVISKMK